MIFVTVFIAIISDYPSNPPNSTQTLGAVPVRSGRKLAGQRQGA